MPLRTLVFSPDDAATCIVLQYRVRLLTCSAPRERWQCMVSSLVSSVSSDALRPRKLFCCWSASTTSTFFGHLRATAGQQYSNTLAVIPQRVKAVRHRRVLSCEHHAISHALDCCVIPFEQTSHVSATCWLGAAPSTATYRPPNSLPLTLPPLRRPCCRPQADIGGAAPRVRPKTRSPVGRSQPGPDALQRAAQLDAPRGASVGLLLAVAAAAQPGEPHHRGGAAQRAGQCAQQHVSSCICTFCSRKRWAHQGHDRGIHLGITYRTVSASGTLAKQCLVTSTVS